MKTDTPENIRIGYQTTYQVLGYDVFVIYAKQGADVLCKNTRASSYSALLLCNFMD